MNFSLANLTPTDTHFHGIAPEKSNYPLGKIALDVQFGTREKFRNEKLEFEVIDWPSQYHALLGRPAYARFMAVLHYTYLLWRIPGPKGPITVKGSFALADKCDKDFHKCRCLFDGTPGSSRGEEEVGVIGRRVLGMVVRDLPSFRTPA
jgi:hypothetical protein